MTCRAPILAPQRTLDCVLLRIRVALALPALILFSWIPAVRCRLLELLFQVRMCLRGNRDDTIDLDFNPNTWLEAHPAVRAHVVWQETDGRLRPHSTWTDAEKRNLYDAFWQARLDEEIGLGAAPPEATPESAGVTTGASGTYYPRAVAWRVFIGYVAQSLAVEEARWVPWSVTAHPAPLLDELFDSRSLFSWDARLGRYLVDDQRHGTVTYGDPVRCFRFLRSAGLLTTTTRATVARLVGWSRTNLVHFLDRLSADNCLNHWGYSGYPPVERMISGTDRLRPAEFGHYTAGCHGTAGFMRALLRVVNVPVIVEHQCRHALPHFPLDNAYLSHGDDPYSRQAYSSPLPSPDSLLISEKTYQTWFGAGVNDTQRCDNVGRQTQELALENPNSDYLLWTRCRDLARGLANADSDIYRQFQTVRTLAELEAARLWERLDAAIAARGGCDRIPPG